MHASSDKPSGFSISIDPCCMLRTQVFCQNQGQHPSDHHAKMTITSTSCCRQAGRREWPLAPAVELKLGKQHLLVYSFFSGTSFSKSMSFSSQHCPLKDQMKTQAVDGILFVCVLHQDPWVLGAWISVFQVSCAHE